MGALLFLLVELAIVVLTIAGLWKIFVKAGKPGWASIVPIYNVVVMLEIAGRPLWWIVLLFVPLVNFVILIVVAIDIAKRFGKGVGYGVGLAFLAPVFYPLLGFSDDQYQA